MTDKKEGEAAKKAELSSLLEAIGYVATGWARLEYEINRMIWALTSMEDEDGACVTAQIPSILPRMRALIALVHKNGGGTALLKDLNKFSADVDGLSRQRNRIIHDPWFVDKEDPGRFGRLEITADRKLVFEIKPHNRPEILTVAREIDAAITEFKAFRPRIVEGLEHKAAQIGSRLSTDSVSSPDQPNPDTENAKPPHPQKPSRG